MRRTPQMGPPPLTLAAGTAVLTLVVAMVAWSEAATDRRLPRSPQAISEALAKGPHAGDCERCHTLHAGDAVPEPHALVEPNDNFLCGTCHTSTPVWEGGSYAGPPLYDGSDHGSNPAMVWPGPEPPGRVEPAAVGKCLNCHDPHGWQDERGTIPYLQLARDEGLCLACHDGSPAASTIGFDQLKPYRHPTQDYSDRHRGPLEMLPSDFGMMPLNRRHAECVDCHNPHVARSQTGAAPGADAVSSVLLGVSRVNVFNGPAGAAPTFEFLAGADTLSAPAGDWQLCFKCHSSWTTQPSGQTDLARVLNPNNPSYHPVEARGANTNIAEAAFVLGWDAGSRTRCGDCHGSDDPLARGPHGSLNRYILKRPYTASAAQRPMSPDETCFACHAYAVYADENSPPFVQSASRFNEPGAGTGHAKHVMAENVPCYACHVTHGSATQPHLIATGRFPGILSYTATLTGGSCATTCHEPKSYDVNYAR